MAASPLTNVFHWGRSKTIWAALVVLRPAELRSCLIEVDELKIAKVSPIFKKDDPTLFKNYRPISLLSTISKIIETIILTQLSSYFNENKLIFDNQHGFRQKHSTEYAALELVDRIITQMDIKEVPINIFLDLSKAFDTIDHTILLAKLRY